MHGTNVVGNWLYIHYAILMVLYFQSKLCAMHLVIPTIRPLIGKWFISKVNASTTSSVARQALQYSHFRYAIPENVHHFYKEMSATVYIYGQVVIMIMFVREHVLLSIWSILVLIGSFNMDICKENLQANIFRQWLLSPWVLSITSSHCWNIFACKFSLHISILKNLSVLVWLCLCP